MWENLVSYVSARESGLLNNESRRSSFISEMRSSFKSDESDRKDGKDGKDGQDASIQKDGNE